MHEMAPCRSLVHPRALAFAFEVTVRDTLAAAAALDIREIPGRAWCTDCAGSVTVPARGEACPHCGGAHLIVERSEEMRLGELEVA